MKRLYLSRDDRKIAGICGGIGETYDLDPTLIRLALIAFTLVTGIVPMVIAYLVSWVIIPKKSE
jgi:phage shock protein C